MIITVTPNPTIDRVLFVRDYDMQDVVRAESEAVSPSGKAIDVAVVLHTFGVETVAMGLNAGHTGEQLEALLDDLGVPYSFVRAEGYTRVAALITDIARQRQSTVLAHTLTADARSLDALIDMAADSMPRSWGVVLAGSIPPGAPQDVYARLITLARQHNVISILDSSGESLRLGIAARPDILKVNLSEIGMLAPEAAQEFIACTESMPNRERAARLADTLSERMSEWTNEALIITLGKLGAVAITPQGRWYVPALSVPFVSPAGAGDGMTSGILLARYRDEPWQNAIAMGTAVAGVRSYESRHLRMPSEPSGGVASDRRDVCFVACTVDIGQHLKTDLRPLACTTKATQRTVGDVCSVLEKRGNYDGF